MYETHVLKEGSFYTNSLLVGVDCGINVNFFCKDEHNRLVDFLNHYNEKRSKKKWPKAIVISDKELLVYIYGNLDSYLSSLCVFSDTFSFAKNRFVSEFNSENCLKFDIEDFDTKLFSRVLSHKEKDSDRLFLQYFFEACRRKLIHLDDSHLKNIATSKNMNEKRLYKFFKKNEDSIDLIIPCNGSVNTMSLISMFKIDDFDNCTIIIKELLEKYLHINDE